MPGPSNVGSGALVRMHLGLAQPSLLALGIPGAPCRKRCACAGGSLAGAAPAPAGGGARSTQWGSARS
eukprot:4906598-Pyramimonas_sp.AAC.1